MTEFSNINSLADNHIWSIIKTLLATLPKLSSMELGPRTVVNECACLSDLDFVEGVRPQGTGGGPWAANLS